MTRRTILALASVLVSLFITVSATTVSADNPCSGFAREHCEAMATADTAVLFSVQVVAPAPTHILASTGIGQEHFEAMQAQPLTLLSVSSPVPVTHLPGFAVEHYETMQNAQTTTP